MASLYDILPQKPIDQIAGNERLLITSDPQSVVTLESFLAWFQGAYLNDALGRPNSLLYVNRRVDLDSSNQTALETKLRALTTIGESPDIRGVGTTLLTYELGREQQLWELVSGVAPSELAYNVVVPSDYHSDTNPVYWRMLNQYHLPNAVFSEDDGIPLVSEDGHPIIFE